MLIYFYRQINSFIKVIGTLSVCVSVPKNFANRSTDMVLLYRVASQVGPWKVFNYFEGGYQQPFKSNYPWKKMGCQI